MEVDTLSLAGTVFADESRDAASARDIPPDITSAQYWSGAWVGAVAWLGFILYAAYRGLG